MRKPSPVVRWYFFNGFNYPFGGAGFRWPIHSIISPKRMARLKNPSSDQIKHKKFFSFRDRISAMICRWFSIFFPIKKWLSSHVWFECLVQTSSFKTTSWSRGWPTPWLGISIIHELWINIKTIPNRGFGNWVDPYQSLWDDDWTLPPNAYPLVNQQFANLNMAIEIVDLCWFTH